MIQKPVIPKFLVFVAPAVKQQHGRPMRSLAICIKTHLCSKFIIRHSSTESLVISLPGIRTSLCSLYSPPKTNIDNIQYNISNISNCLAINPRSDTIFMAGDFKGRRDLDHKRGR